MIRRWILFSIGLALLLPTLNIYSQTDGVEIRSPQPVSLLRGTVDIVGTANVPAQNGFFVQFRALNTDLTPVGGERALWSPATLPSPTVVIDDLLGTWNTTLVPDGIYELELVVNRTNGEPIRTRLSPLRVANTTPQYRGGRFLDDAPAQTATPTANALPTQSLAPTLAATAAPRTVTATATIQANVRTGDSTLYPPVGFLDVGQSAQVIGVSSRSTWILVRLPNGDEGFMSPSTVRIDGDLSTLPQVTPPPPPVTPTPVPTATPVAQANLRIIGVRLSSNPPICNQTFTIFATVQNVGTGSTNASATINVGDRHLASGQIVQGTVGAVPSLGAGQIFEAVIPLTVSAYYEEVHRIELTVDSTGAVPETNEGDNGFSIDYTLVKGGCS